MGGIGIIEQLGIDSKILDSKKEQTTKKVEYVRAYVEKWLWVWVTNPDTKSITFIDAMANADIYKDGDLCTVAEVAKLFGRFAKGHPRIAFRLYVNEIDRARSSLQHFAVVIAILETLTTLLAQKMSLERHF